MYIIDIAVIIHACEWMQWI